MNSRAETAGGKGEKENVVDVSCDQHPFRVCRCPQSSGGGRGPQACLSFDRRGNAPGARHTVPGNMDKWDPAFIDALANSGFRVITFDYSGLGLSTGRATYNPIEMAADFRDLIVGLQFKDVVIAGWSLGGLAAQSALALYPKDITHLVLIGSGRRESWSRRRSRSSMKSRRRRSTTRTTTSSCSSNRHRRRAGLRLPCHSNAWQCARTVTVQKCQSTLPAQRLEPSRRTRSSQADPVLEALKQTAVPVLHVGGDHDISFPIENWYALSPHTEDSAAGDVSTDRSRSAITSTRRWPRTPSPASSATP